MERVKMEKALEHLKAALAIIDAEGNALAAAKLCQVIELVQVCSEQPDASFVNLTNAEGSRPQFCRRQRAATITPKQCTDEAGRVGKARHEEIRGDRSGIHNSSKAFDANIHPGPEAASCILYNGNRSAIGPLTYPAVDRSVRRRIDVNLRYVSNGGKIGHGHLEYHGTRIIGSDLDGDNTINVVRANVSRPSPFATIDEKATQLYRTSHPSLTNGCNHYLAITGLHLWRGKLLSRRKIIRIHVNYHAVCRGDRTFNRLPLSYVGQRDHSNQSSNQKTHVFSPSLNSTSPIKSVAALLGPIRGQIVPLRRQAKLATAEARPNDGGRAASVLEQGLVPFAGIEPPRDYRGPLRRDVAQLDPTGADDGDRILVGLMLGLPH
ncbi:hypothetical protein WR25_19867 [Diploscapter pachys]|uniref:Uncharacterized protein n=1 Tax=Diploscapter pachys TaxID=2018661 RepID=A0A2A2JWJ8_9BILA|nr:hypothetical protein WR25_19867 [Diploscapter pachys]